MIRVTEDKYSGLSEGVLERTDMVLRVEDEEGLILHLGYTVTNLLVREVYVWLVPGPSLAPVKMREAKRLWENKTRDWKTIIALVSREDRKARRFAEFFGLEPLGEYYEGEEFYGVRRSSPFDPQRGSSASRGDAAGAVYDSGGGIPGRRCA